MVKNIERFLRGLAYDFNATGVLVL